MASVDLIVGDYTIPANSTQVFTFWWPSADTPISQVFFDVSIIPKPDQAHSGISPLVEVKRERGVPETPDKRHVLYLTLQNNNGFAVDFYAGHVKVYND